jgi:hypothetical protein
MADQVILQTVGDAERAERILDEFEQRTGLRADVGDEGRIYDIHDDEHRTRIVQTLTDIDDHWTDHLGFKLPG